MAIKTVENMTAAELDAFVYDQREAGTTWKSIALTCGWGWHKTNMDGGRAKRAYNRHAKRLAALEAEQEATHGEGVVVTVTDGTMHIEAIDKEIWTVADEEMAEAGDEEETDEDILLARRAEGASWRTIAEELGAGWTISKVRRAHAKLIAELVEA